MGNKTKIRYCYLKPDLSFSDSWDEESHKRDFTGLDLEGYMKSKDGDGWRLIKFEVVIGDDFEFQDNMVLNTKPK